MAKLIPSKFCTYELSEEEYLRGSQFNSEQKMYLQNVLATYAAETLALRYDPEKPLEFVQQDAEKRGVTVFIEFLLATSDESAARQNPQQSN